MKPKKHKEKTIPQPLLERFIAGDDTAYEEIYRLYARDLYAFGLSMRVRQELIEDAMHDVFVEVYGRREKMGAVQNLKLYLMVAFKNRLFYLLKKEEISAGVGERYSRFYGEKDFPETVSDQQEEAQEKERAVKRILSELSVHQQEVVYHRFIEGLSLEEIALLMNINYQSVKNLLHRTMKKIRAIHPGGININAVLLWAATLLALGTVAG